MDRWRNGINIGVALIAIAFLCSLIGAAWLNRYDPVLTELVVKNFAAIIGLPFAFLGAFIVVALFRQAEGSVELEVIGIKLKGASGQILL